MTREQSEYRRVHVAGVFLHEKETLVQAVTEYGAGYWVLTPLRTDWGTVLINRGFVSPRRKTPQSRAIGATKGISAVEGLLRMSEPGGAFLRQNAPDQNRWYSRDVPAIAEARNLTAYAPYFIDAGANAAPGGWPKGGLTVVSFRNAHLQYALTWFALALLSICGLLIVSRRT